MEHKENAMEISKRDWKLFREKVPDWQEHYMEELVRAYVAFLSDNSKIKTFIREFEKITDNYRQAVNPNVAAIVIHPDLESRMDALKNYL